MSGGVLIPEGMLKAAVNATHPTTGQFAILRDGLEAALLWLENNPDDSKEELIESLQEICEEHGCPAGWNRLTFLRDFLRLQKGTIAALEAQVAALEPKEPSA